MIRAKFAIIKQHIVKQIESGVWGENSKLPSENQLAQMFHCSRMTARRAITELCDSGVLERSQGIGTFVSGLASQSSMLAIRDIAAEIRSRGHDYNVLQLALEARQANREIASALNVSIDDPVFYSELLHYEQDKPIQLECRFVNPHLVPHYLEQSFNQMTPHEYLSNVAPLTEAHHKVQAVLPDMTQIQRLELTTMEACLLIIRRTWSNQGVVSYSKLIHPGSRFHLGGHLTF